VSDPHRSFFERFLNDSLKGMIVVVLKKQLLPSNASMDDVINHASRRDTSCSRHSTSLAKRANIVTNWTRPRFSAGALGHRFMDLAPRTELTTCQIWHTLV
jgi:hypothetical protein